MNDAAEKFSGAPIERVVTTDGRRFIVKSLPPEGDWLTRGTDGLGRMRLLWDDGVLDRLPPVVDHATVSMVRSDGGDVVVMRDVSDALVPSSVAIPVGTAERLVQGLAAMHAAWEGFSAPYCSVAARLRLFAPAVHAADDGHHPHPLRESIVEGWDVFADLVPSQVAAVVAGVHEAPELLARRLERAASPTLLHGDVKPENLGLSDGQLVAIDWGELTGTGPAETDVAWFAVQGTWRVDMLPDEVFWLYDQHATRPLDRTALDLACVGAVAQMGFKLALRAVRAPDEGVRARARTLLAWWVSRVDEALERTPVV